MGQSSEGWVYWGDGYYFSAHDCPKHNTHVRQNTRLLRHYAQMHQSELTALFSAFRRDDPEYYELSRLMALGVDGDRGLLPRAKAL